MQKRKHRITFRVPNDLYRRLVSFQKEIQKENPRYSQKTRVVLHLIELGLDSSGRGK